MQTMLTFAEALRTRGAWSRVLNLGGGDVDTHTPMGSMAITVMAALAQVELEIKRERITDSVVKRRAAGKDLGGRRPTFTDSQIRNALRLIESGACHPGGPGSGDVQSHSLPADPGFTHVKHLSRHCP
jgi:DNA invertase Pin-like site-specific DNA recombinase